MEEGIAVTIKPKRANALRFEINGQVYAFQLEYGAVIAYKTIDLSRFPNSLLSFANKALVTLLEGESIVAIEG